MALGNKKLKFGAKARDEAPIPNFKKDHTLK
ncbi:hypothetical protein DET65_4071 [Sunxiuqinia elliptica]|uniref:Uncharacterized protein n=1 Tax=Sunxiuqinia elliptica TaxID=655355 RepID=A0A4R6GWE2_9BACT|nr:hypothetical protein DET52_107207 [Sunxiuqinia elliptica]TDO56515.1 hypothetical protein DET65_4071 [Sunxiuqinia elliptica]